MTDSYEQQQAGDGGDGEPNDGRYPHQLLERYVAHAIGRRSERFGEFADDLFIPLVRSISDQLSIYNDVRNYANLKVGDVTLREGAERSYVLAEILDGNAPLRLRGAKEHWGISLETNYEMELLRLINGRRWRFIDKWLTRFLGPLLEKVSDAMVEYYIRKPNTVARAGIIRFLEGVDATYLCLEIDDKSVDGSKDTAGRYRVQ